MQPVNREHVTAGTMAHVISIISGKGGVGKSVIALNLAERMASQGVSTLAVDVDGMSGNLHLLANVAAERGIDQYAAGEMTLAQAVTPLGPNFDLLARTETGPIAGLGDNNAALQLVTKLRVDASWYDAIIIDHGPGVSSLSTLIAQSSDICVIVIVPELTSIADGYGLYKYLRKLNKSLDCRLLVNRAKSRGDAEYIAVKFGMMAEQFLGSSPASIGWLSEDDGVALAVSSQKTLAQFDIHSIVSQQVNTIAEELATAGSAARQARMTSQDHLLEPAANTPHAINNSPATADIKG